LVSNILNFKKLSVWLVILESYLSQSDLLFDMLY
jgi:hypothetical protein